MFLAVILPFPLYLGWETMRLTSGLSSSGVGISLTRLRVRLKFFSQRFRRSQAGWQFALWGRQLALVLIVNFTPDAITGAALALLVMAVALYFHVRCRPFRFQLTNLVESGLLVTCCLLLGLACIYDRVSLFTEGWVRVILQVLLVIPIYGVVFGTLAGVLWLSTNWAGDMWVEEEDVDWDEDEVDDEDKDRSGENIYAPHDAL